MKTTPKRTQTGLHVKNIPRNMVAKHCHIHDNWIIIDGNVYDMSGYARIHPGGFLPLMHMAGKDATDVFHSHHPESVYRMLRCRFVCKVADYHPTKIQMAYRKAHQQLIREGLFETRYSFYLWNVLWLLLLLAVTVQCTVMHSARSIHVLAAALLGLFWQQIAGMGHDAGHNGITHNRKIDSIIGLLVGNLFSGIGIGWWKHSHNVHHVATNSIEHDPDIQHMPVFAIARDVTYKFYSSYHRKWFNDNQQSVILALVRMQHWLFYPIMTVARFNLYAQSFILLCTTSSGIGLKTRIVEGVASLGFLYWFSSLLAYMPVMPEQSAFCERVLYILISHAVAGVLHVQICLSHFSMHAYHGVPCDDWFTTQLRTTMNINCPGYLDWFHIGLQYQIEHHLWPRLPRHNLRRASAIVRRICTEHDIKYHSRPWFRAQIELHNHLQHVAKSITCRQE